jgi:predicted ArsR family transcriptional regulator
MLVDPISTIPEVQQRILALLKQHGELTLADLAAHLHVSYEAVRQQMNPLLAQRLVAASRRPNPSGAGRPLRYYTLSASGDHLFPKNYDDLAVGLIDAVGDELGTEALRRVLARIAAAQVAAWEPRVAGLSLEQRLRVLTNYYIEGDPFTDVHASGDALQLVERNCPYLNVATRRPALCSVTVSVLSRLLGYRVTRTERFQDGDGRCRFHVHRDRPLESAEFRFESEMN